MYRSIIFTIIFPAETGSMVKVTIWGPLPTVTGFTPTTDGHGSRTRISAGLPIIMAVGRISQTTGGSGFPARISTGDRHGSPGGPVGIMLAGRLCRHADRASFTRDGRLGL